MTEHAVADSQEDARARPRLASGILSRAITLPVTVLATMVTASITIQAVGPELYGQVAMVATLAALVPFADLGLGAAVVNAVGEAEDYRNDVGVRRTLYTSVRLLCLSGLTLAGVAGLLAVLDLWPTLLGVGDSSYFNAATFAALAIFGLTLPVGIGGRLLQATGRNHLTVLLMGMVPLVGLLLTVIFGMLEVEAAWYSVVPSLALFSISMIGMVVAVRLCQIPMGSIAGQALLFRRWPGGKVFHVAGPMLVIMIGLPLSLQSHRLIISHLSTNDDLTQYALGAQLYASLWGILAAGGQSLWPTLTYKRSRADPITDVWWRAFWALVALALGMSIAYVTLGQFVVDVMTNREVVLGLSVLVGFSVLLLVQAAQLPCGMLLTKPGELSFQARCIVVMLIVNIPLSVVFTSFLGASGPVFASALAVVLCQLIPGRNRVRQVLRTPGS